MKSGTPLPAVGNNTLCSNGFAYSVASVMSNSCDPMDCSLPGSYVHGDLPGPWGHCRELSAQGARVSAGQEGLGSEEPRLPGCRLVPPAPRATSPSCPCPLLQLHQPPALPPPRIPTGNSGLRAQVFTSFTVLLRSHLSKEACPDHPVSRCPLRPTQHPGA